MSIRERAQTEADRWYPVFNHIGSVQNQAFVRGAEWAASQEPTDDEVLAALNAQRAVVSSPHGDAMALDDYADTSVTGMRAALRAAREARA